MGDKRTKHPPQKRKPDPIGNSEQTSESGAGVARRFMVVFDLEHPQSPYLEAEYGADGAVASAYAREFAAWFRSEFVSVAHRRVMKRGYVALIGTANYADLGVVTGDEGQIKRGLRQALDALLVEQADRAEPVVTVDAQCRLEVSFCTGTLIDRHFELWQAAVSGASSGQVWEELSLHQPEEELQMPLNLASVLERIEALDEENHRAQRAVVQKAASFLQSLEGLSFESLQENQEMANAIQELLSRLNCRIVCPKAGCGEPAILDCRQAGRAKYGTFKFRHAIDGVHRNHASSTKLPRLELIPAPAEVRRTTGVS